MTHVNVCLLIQKAQAKLPNLATINEESPLLLSWLDTHLDTAQLNKMVSVKYALLHIGGRTSHSAPSYVHLKSQLFLNK